MDDLQKPNILSEKNPPFEQMENGSTKGSTNLLKMQKSLNPSSSCFKGFCIKFQTLFSTSYSSLKINSSTMFSLFHIVHFWFAAFLKFLPLSKQNLETSSTSCKGLYIH